MAGEDVKLRDKARDLSALFGDGRALDELKKVALDKDADLAARKVALFTAAMISWTTISPCAV